MHENTHIIYLNGTKFTVHENARLARWYHPMVLAFQGLPTAETVFYEHRNPVVVSNMVSKF